MTKRLQKPYLLVNDHVVAEVAIGVSLTEFCFRIQKDPRSKRVILQIGEAVTVNLRVENARQLAEALLTTAEEISPLPPKV